MEGERARKASGLWNTLNVLGDQFLPGHSVTWGHKGTPTRTLGFGFHVQNRAPVRLSPAPGIR